VTLLAGGLSVLPACNKSRGRWRFFTEEEADAVYAICEQIIPTDQDPGAAYAGVPNFIDKQLAGPYRRFQTAYRNGLRGIQETSRAMFHGRFESLAWEKQTEVLKSLEAGKAESAAWKSQNPREFFELIRDHTMQGFYGSPRHGGNYDYVSYRMLGLDYPQVIGRNRYKKA
jgi:gluconate 2-dehydrogenase gamma chain